MYVTVYVWCSVMKNNFIIEFNVTYNGFHKQCHGYFSIKMEGFHYHAMFHMLYV